MVFVVFVAEVDGQPQEILATPGHAVTLPCYVDYSDVSEAPSDIRVVTQLLVMVALCNRADHYIFMLWFVLSSSSSFFLRLISAAADWMSAILPHMVWP